MLISLYSLLLAVALAVTAPWWLYRMATSGRYRAGLLQRLGRVPAALRAAAAGKQVIWLHAVSVGELLAAQRLLQDLAEKLGPDYLIAISTTTATAQTLAHERLATSDTFGPPGCHSSAQREDLRFFSSTRAEEPVILSEGGRKPAAVEGPASSALKSGTACSVFFYPLDFRFAVRPYLRALQPKLVILMESELWPRLLHECAAAHIPVAVANARVSDRSFRRTYPFRSIWLRMARHVTLFLAQSQETATRLEQLGIPPTRIQTPGNLKYDIGEIRRTRITHQLRRARGDSRVIVAGSTLPDEEAMLLNAFPKILRGGSDFILVIAPRHPDRFQSVWNLIKQSKYPAIRCSTWNPDQQPLTGGMVLLLDTLGDLASAYSVATVAFIGGSLVQKGGHNPLEAARYGKAIVMGKSYENFREIVREMGTIHLIEREHLAEALISGTRNGKSFGRRGRAFFNSQSGATARTITAFLQLIQRESRP